MLNRWQISLMTKSYSNGLQYAQLCNVKLERWWWGCCKSDNVGFLGSYPPDQLAYTSANLGLKLKITTINNTSKPVLLLWYVVGRTAEPQMFLNNPPRTTDPHCVRLIVSPFVSSTWSEMLDVHTLPLGISWMQSRKWEACGNSHFQKLWKWTWLNWKKMCRTPPPPPNICILNL